MDAFEEPYKRDPNLEKDPGLFGRGHLQTDSRGSWPVSLF